MVGAPQCFAVELDLCCELGAAVAVPPVQLLELALGDGQMLGGALSIPVELLLLLVNEVEDRVPGFSALVERKWLGGGAFEGAGSALRRASRIRLAEGRRLALERVVLGEVELGLQAGAGAGDVAPLAEGALVGEEDEGTIDRNALGGVAGEGVAVVEVVGCIGEADVPVDAGSVANNEAFVVDVPRRCPACRCGDRAGRRFCGRGPARRRGTRARLA